MAQINVSWVLLLLLFLPVGGRTRLQVSGCCSVSLAQIITFSAHIYSNFPPTEGSVITSIITLFGGGVLTYSSVLLTVCVMHPMLSWQYFWGCSEKQQLVNVGPLLADFVRNDFTRAENVTAKSVFHKTHHLVLFVIRIASNIRKLRIAPFAWCVA